MCGRYAASRDAIEVAQAFGAEQLPTTDVAPRIPNFNVAPTTEVFIVCENDGVRSVDVARWGLIPSWSKDASKAARMINARSETVADKPAYRAAFRRRRCLVPADGYYEWQAPSADRAKQPFFIHDAERKPLAFAGLFEDWTSPEGVVRSCTILTQEARGTLARIHDRMPVLVSDATIDHWLDPTTADPLEVLATMCADEAELEALRAYPVSTAVNKPVNNDATLVDPIGPELRA